VLVGLGYTLVEPQLLSLEQTSTGTPVVAEVEDYLALGLLGLLLLVLTTVAMLVEVQEA
jgi:hypothetical protein